MAKKKNEGTSSIDELLEVSQGHASAFVVGQTPLILNRMSEKAKHELLLPKPKRKNAAELAARLKHNPREEYVASAYRFTQASAQTHLGILTTSFKKAMMTAALDLPGTKKAQIGRLLYVEGQYVYVYGVPQLFMSVVRSADMNRTPDVRTRAILPRWACVVDVTFMTPLITGQAVSRLMAAAGQFCGVGDWRQEKGSGNYGLFRLAKDETDEEFADIVSTGGKQAQIDALATPVCYDDETAELLGWFDSELDARRNKGTVAA